MALTDLSINFNRLPVDSVEISTWCHYIQNNNYSISSFAISFSFLFSPFLIVLTRISTTELNKSGDSRHSYLVSDLRGQV